MGRKALDIMESRLSGSAGENDGLGQGAGEEKG
jgi:hypothetical protein